MSNHDAICKNCHYFNLQVRTRGGCFGECNQCALGDYNILFEEMTPYPEPHFFELSDDAIEEEEERYINPYTLHGVSPKDFMVV